jgi:outer membrane murein-binding lipoprotein Lpp
MKIRIRSIFGCAWVDTIGALSSENQTLNNKSVSLAQYDDAISYGKSNHKPTATNAKQLILSTTPFIHHRFFYKYNNLFTKTVTPVVPGYYEPL